MAKVYLTDEQVETEIARLSESEAVSLARYEIRLQYRRRQRLYTLRALEKRGKELIDSGITREMLNEKYNASDEDDITEVTVADED